MSAKTQCTGSGPKRDDYERPTVTPLGTIAELTAGASSVGTDIVFSGTVSDRRLKHDLRPLEPASVLSTLAGLTL